MRVGNLHRLDRRELLRGSAAFAFMGAQTRLSEAAGLYAWRPATAATGAGDTLQARFSPPPGFIRDAVADRSFAAWLRTLPLKEQGARVHLYTGAEKSRQDVHAGVIDIDVGGRDLQQCADAVMRLRAEWLFGTGRSSEIAFNMTEGGRVPFSRWARGERSSPSGKRWRKTAAADSSYASFRKYMDFVFSYAGTASLAKELEPVPDGEIAIGDVFIKGGFPGHAVLVADLVHNAATQSKRFLLIQSYMPAQEMHVLRNPQNGDGSPWYGVPAGNLITPEWTFAPGSLRRWPSSR